MEGIRISKSHYGMSRMPKVEFDLTKQFLDMFDITVDSDYTIVSPDSFDPMICGSKVLGFAERFSSLSKIPQDLILFRPFRNEKHADILISMFEELDYIDYDAIDINEYEKDGRPKYSGWLTKNGKVIDGSYVKTSPSVAILKLSIIASMMMDPDEHAEYMNNLMIFLGRKPKEEKKDSDNEQKEDSIPAN